MEDTEIRLEPVTVNNWKACIALELAPDQERFVPSNLYSIALDFIHFTWRNR